ncbi:16192_t:CDS:1 [Dentiscutata erythropus]|uniref:16192_t:CDS:1 n=1 Tax=Dentiscutata erythropus TaxID=1348616 RepID=A0A9N9BHM5_9GLOM|nr:16192_t:CDS:1 [Dentiscutata erythropus]
MATINVTYGNTIHNITLSPNSTWLELVSNLRDLFQIPRGAFITVSYIDEDGDIITISSDIELWEFFSQYSVNNTIKLTLNTTNSLINNEGTSASMPIIETTTALEQLNINDETLKSNHSHVTLDTNQQKTTSEIDNAAWSSSITNHILNEADEEDEPEIIIIFSRRPFRKFRQYSHRYSGCPHYGERNTHGRHHPYKYQLNSEELTEKVKILNSMGFRDTSHRKYEELLERFNGNISRVVDVLVREQESRKQDDKSEQEQLGEPGEASNNIAMEITDSENRPYFL